MCTESSIFVVFFGQISEWLIRNTTDYMISGGFKDAGYEYIIIDDCWPEKERDPVTKELVPDRKRFPSGMKALSDYVCCSFFYFSRFYPCEL